jgi:transitional endoplasmic reticulum ATPase
VEEDQPPKGKTISLRVKKAHERDAGRFIIRINSATMEKLRVQTGDIIGIKGRKQTAGIVWPAYPQDEGQSIIRMDGRMRRNAGVSLEEPISVYTVQERPALSVVLAPLEMRFPVKDFDDFVKQKLLNCPVVKDDTVHVSILGRPVRFVVRRSRPTGVVLIALNSQLTIQSEPPKELDIGVPLITYEEIGGLEHEIQRIREMVELPLKHPELFARLGIAPPKGVLLFGPPGCGKTLLAQAVANESEAHFISINGPEIMSKFYGESEKRLRQIFEEAEKSAPSIVFIDELDAIAPKREEVIGEVERRVVAQLLAVMDGLQKRGQVIVIGASNRPNAIDPALRRPGRFDREIEIRVPDKEGRLQILNIHSRGMPLESVKPENIAEITHGFVGADLAALCREAAMNALRRYLPRINLEEDEIPPEVLEDLRVTNDDFIEALREIQPTAMREVTIEVPNVRWTDVGGLEIIKHKLQQAVQWPLQHPESFTRMGVEPPRGVLLYGPPGCGKTMLARAVATESEANFISIKGPEVLCVGPDTPIISSHCGLRPIKQLYETIKLDGDIHQTENYEIVTPSEIIEVPAMDKEGNITLSRILNAHKLFVEEVYKLRFSNNSSIEVSANQPFYSFRSNRLQWVKAQELKEDDWIAVPSYLPPFNRSPTLQLPSYKHLRVINEDEEAWNVRIFSSHSITKFPKTLSTELAEFLGWFAAEGNISNRTVSISNYSKRNLDRVRKLFELFVAKERIKENQHGLLVYSSPLEKYLEKIFEMPLKAKTYTIQVPPIIFKAAYSEISAFLRGAWSGDGYISKTRIEYSSASKKLAQGIIYLLSLLHVKAKYWKRSDEIHMVTISGKKEMNRFRNEVLREDLNETIRRHYSARYPIPDVAEILRETKNELKLKYGSHLPESLCEPVINGRKRCGLVRFQRIMKFIERHATDEFRKTATYINLKKISSGELAWIQIESKTLSTPQWMFDVETEHSSFVGGQLPLLLHNSKWVGESEKAIREVFRRARHAAPAIIFFDEIDAIAPARGTGAGDSHVTERVISQFLTEIDGIQSLKDIVVLAATNRPDLLDPAMLRPGRFDRHILVPAPDEAARKMIFEIYTKGMPIDKDVDLDELVKLSRNFAGSDIAACCREAALAALEEDMKSNKITRKHFLKAVEEVTPTITAEMEKAYLTWGKRAKQTRPSTSPFT